jgi:hypothetical protein
MKMKVDELKLRLHKLVNDTIDLYMPPTDFIEKMKNTTAKLWVDQNAWRINKILNAFADEYHEIDVEKVIEYYEDGLFENGEMRVDVKSMLPDSMQWLKDMLPNKIILFKIDDFKSIFR